MSLPKWATGFGAQVIYGLIIGLILGFVANDWLAGLLDWVGGTYVQLLKLLIPPLVFTAVVTSIAKLREVTNAARLAAQTLIWFAITAFFSVIIGIAVGAILKPGANSTVDAAEAAEPSTTGSWMGFLDSVVPSNFLGLGTNGESVSFNVLQILVVSLLIGIAAVKAGKSAEPFIQFSESLLSLSLIHI